MNRGPRLWIAVWIFFCAAVAPRAGTMAAESEQLGAFPAALGWAAATPGGRSGQVIRVTSLAADGPGSLRSAVEQTGPRIVVFEVGGVIDLARRSISIREPFLTIAGQTAPEPGITLIRGGMGIAAHDVVVQHLSVRPGDAGAAKKSGWEVDGIATNGAWNVIIDHCSCTWATDENLSASGPRFEGDTINDWRQGTSHKVTFSNCLIAEGLSNSSHGKGEHSKGSLIHDNAAEIAIIGNLYAHNVERNPLFKGGARGVIVNNYIYNPGRRAMHFGLVSEEWGTHQYAAGQMVAVGNVLQFGPDTRSDVTLLSFGGNGPCQVFLKDNAVLGGGPSATSQLLSLSGRGPQAVCTSVDQPLLWPPGLSAMPASEVKDFVLKNAGARPWARDAVDARIVAEIVKGEGRIIDSQDQVGGYPAYAATQRAFDADEWDLSSMTRK